MAEKKNFTIENYNGTDYDTLYPETNSGQVLLDSDAQVELKLASGSTLDDAIHAITKEGGTFQVGDTLTTARTNLGDKWLLCNGAQVTNSSYPELAPMFESKELDFVTSESLSLSQFSSRIFEPALAVNNDGSQFLFSGYENNYTQFLYTTDLYDASKYQTAFTTISDNLSEIDHRISCINNVWFAFGTNGALYYKEGDLSSTQKQVTVGTVSGATVRLIALPIYYNSKYYIPGAYTNSSDTSVSVMCIYTSLDAVPTIVDFVRYNSPYTLLPDGICVASNSSYTPTMNISILNNSNQVVSYQYTNFDGLAFSSTAIYYLNGYYYLFNVNNQSGSIKTKIFRSTNLNSMSLYKTLPDSIVLYGALQTDDKIIFSNGYYLDVNGNINPWSNYVDGGTNYQTQVVTGGGKYWRIVTKSNSASITPYYAQQGLSFTLPKVSVANTLYTYIKAKS